ncbi:acylneuraminate cytidylyltransferase family protein [Brevibacillus centrosporus]|uniref:acylneuraminate cytidylyltransferase family protein n=1 Tax=Brevibacillus centrosporus TaxID=54910 RepID=UPI002E1DA284|nr:acylneuraminate cytidylyltransferase family protein [Brevibacillus centrosporus]
MIQGKLVLALIPARGGSKGVPRKNIRSLGGKPLIAWTIEEAKKSAYIDRVVLTSDDAEIIQVSKDLGCEVPFVRPKELAQDDTPGITPVLHAMENLPGYDYIILLQPTSPLRKAEDIDGCILHCIEQKANVCVSVTEQEKSPYWMYQMNAMGQLDPLLSSPGYARRQETPPVYTLNGAIYVANTSWLQEKQTFLSDETLGYVMSKERSIDIDTELDFIVADSLLALRTKNF